MLLLPCQLLLLQSLDKLSTGTAVLLSDDKTIVELHNIKTASVPALSDIATRVENDWKNSEANLQYTRQLDQLTELAYTTDSIDDLAKQLHLTVQFTDRLINIIHLSVCQVPSLYKSRHFQSKYSKTICILVLLR